MPKVSVVVPAYNAEGTLGQTLASVLGQTFEDLEVVVVDDGSSDGTADVARAGGDARVRLVQVQNGGVARARNRGVAEAQGELIAFLDSDDVWLSEKLESQVEMMGARNEIGVVFTAARYVDSQMRSIGEIPALDYADYSEALLLYSVVIAGSCSSGMVRRTIVDDVGGFDPAFSQSADWDFWLRVSRVTQIAPVAASLVLCRKHTSNMSSDVSLLERDTFAVLKKTFEDPAFVPYQPIRRRVYSNHWLICSGSYLHAGQLGPALRCLARAVQEDPSNAARPLGFPVRWLRRVSSGRQRQA